MDEFENWVEGISNTASYSDQRDLMRVVLKHYRAFKAKQEAKPTAPARLVEELKEVQNELYNLKIKEREGLADPENQLNDRYRLGMSAGLGIASDTLLEALNRHEARKEVVLAKNHSFPFIGEDAIGIVRIQWGRELMGKRGKLIFVEGDNA